MYCCTNVFSSFVCYPLTLFRWLCSNPGQPLPSEPASSPHPQPDARQSDALWLWQHGRAHRPFLHASSARPHGPSDRYGPHGPLDAWSGCCGRHGDERRDSILHVHAPAPDEHAPPGWDSKHRNHQPVPFVRGWQGEGHHGVTLPFTLQL